MTADYLRRLAGAATATLGDIRTDVLTPPPAPSWQPHEEPAPEEPLLERESSAPPVSVRPGTGSPETRYGEHAAPVPAPATAAEVMPGPDVSDTPDTSMARAPERPSISPPIPAARSLAAPATATPVPATTGTGPSGTSVLRPAGAAHADARPAPGSDSRTAPDHTAAPLRHAGIRAVQDLGVRQTGDRAHQRPVTAPDAVDPRVREHLDGLGQRLLAAHPPPTPATADQPAATAPSVATAVATTAPPPAGPPATAGPVAHEVRPSPAPPHNSQPVTANPEPALTIDHLEVRVVVEPPPRQQAAPAPRPPSGARPAWTDSARRYLRNR